MANPFQYRQPTSDQVEVMQAIAEHLSTLYAYIQVAVPASAERTLGIRKLQEARMWLNASLVLHPEPELATGAPVA
jgi:hypothetical protein